MILAWPLHSLHHGWNTEAIKADNHITALAASRNTPSNRDRTSYEYDCFVRSRGGRGQEGKVEE